MAALTFPFVRWRRPWASPFNGTDEISPSLSAGAIPLSLVSTCSYPRATVTRIVNGTTLDIRYDNGRTRRVKLHAFRPRTPDSDRGYLSNLDVHRMLLLNQQVYVVETKTGNDEVFIFMHRPIHNRPTEDEVKRLCYNYFAPRILSD